MTMPGIQELVVVAVVVFILFGVKRIPEIFKSLGQTMREIKHINKEIEK